MNPLLCTSLTSFSCPQCGTCSCEPDPREWTNLFVRNDDFTRAETKRFLELGFELDDKIKASDCPLHNGTSQHALLTVEP